MRILVVHAHPLANSFNHALFELACTTLADQGHEVDPLDLYGRGYDPVLSAAERRAYNEAPLWDGIAEDLRRLALCQGLVFVYPTWWYSHPAMLKGWLDRVLVPGVCYTLPDAHRPIQPLMQHIGLLGGISTYGAPWWFTRWVGDPGRRIIMRGLKPLFHPRCRSFWCALHEIDSADGDDRERFKSRVRRRLAGLPQVVPTAPECMGDRPHWA